VAMDGQVYSFGLEKLGRLGKGPEITILKEP